mgnify:CR=1 FL=1
MKITIIGIGLIGGSMAISLKESGFADEIIGIILSIPVNAIVQVLPEVLDRLVDGQVVIDVGSTKTAVMSVVAAHPRRKQYVATHPMAGTEFSGPEAAIPNLFDGNCTVLCEVGQSHVCHRLHKRGSSGRSTPVSFGYAG